jgi:hypothetical protein
MMMGGMGGMYPGYMPGFEPMYGGGQYSQSDQLIQGMGNLGGGLGSIAGGMGGAMYGAAIGTAICPGLGTIAGALVGGVAGSAVGKFLGKAGFCLGGIASGAVCYSEADNNFIFCKF